MRRAALLLFVCLCAVVLIAPSVRADGPTLVGKVAEDGTLMAIWHKDWLGQYQPIEKLEVLEHNEIWVSLYNPLGNGTTTITIHQYRTRTHIIERVVDNQTIKEEVVELYDHEWTNTTVSTPERLIITTQIDIPASRERRWLVVSYRNVEWKVPHETLPTLFIVPDFTQGNLIIFAIIVMAVTAGVWGIATATAAAILKRVNFVPRMSLAAMLLYLIPIIGVAAFLLYSAFYSEIAGLSWYIWEVPMWLIATVVMLQYLPTRARRWIFFQATRDENRTDELITPLREIVVSKDRDGEHFMVHPTSWRQVVYRLLGKRPKVQFEKGPKPWYGKNTLAKKHPRDPYRVYYLDHDKKPDIAYPKLTWKKLWKIPYLGLSDGQCAIPLSGAHSRPVMSWMSNAICLEDVARSREQLIYENTDLHAKVLTGATQEERNILYTWLKRMGKEDDPEKFVPKKQLLEKGEDKEKEKAGAAA